MVNSAANLIERVPRGSARSRVLGFDLSKWKSAIRLKVMAALLAPTIAARIQNACQSVGKPFRASNAPINAKGRAKSVCSNLIMSSVICNLRQINVKLPIFKSLSLTHYDLFKETT